jgi:thiosulfate reductase cytochrome b subunit
LILAILGVREGHEISTGKAVLAVLLPLIIVFGLGILLAIFIPLFIGSLGSYRGMRA